MPTNEPAQSVPFSGLNRMASQLKPHEWLTVALSTEGVLTIKLQGRRPNSDG